MFAHQSEHQSPLSRLGFVIFSVLNSQCLAFTYREMAQKPVIPAIFYLYQSLISSIYSHLIGAMSDHKSGFCRLLAT
ncbi:hypothetical protein, partial [Aeromonas sobria]|uniref:hypothetical protein n=1 Tax=Aeromonas sobria TaxID=646 RepID=UPI001CA343F9